MALLAATLSVLPEGWIAQLASCALLLWVVRAVGQWYRLRHIPGPASAGWSKWWQLSGALSGSYHEKLHSACEEYGSLVRIGPTQLLTSDPELLKRIAAPRSKYGKAPFYTSGRIVPGVDNVVSTRDEEKHKKMRAEMAPAFSIRPNSRQTFEAGIDRQLLSFISMLERNYTSPTETPTPLDLAEKTQFFCLDVIGDIFMSEPFGYLAADKDLYDYNQINMTSLPAMNVVSVLPGLTDIIHKWPMRLVMPKEGDKVGFGRLMSTVRSFVDTRLGSKEYFDDMMQILIDSGVSREQLIQQTLIAVIAGSNSTAHALRMVLYGLMTTPHALAALLAEIDALGSAASNPVSWSEIQKLPYLKAAVQEGLRMWPPVAGLAFKTVPPAGEYIHGYWVPGGTEIGQAFHAVGRSKELWGDDADVFRPERWLEASEADARAMAVAVDTHFGGGRFSCLGKPIAMVEIHKAVFELVKQFDMDIIHPDSPIKVTACVFVFATDFWVNLRHRSR